MKKNKEDIKEGIKLLISLVLWGIVVPTLIAGPIVLFVSRIPTRDDAICAVESGVVVDKSATVLEDLGNQEVNFNIIVYIEYEFHDKEQSTIRYFTVPYETYSEIEIGEKVSTSFLEKSAEQLQ